MTQLTTLFEEKFVRVGGRSYDADDFPSEGLMEMLIRGNKLAFNDWNKDAQTKWLREVKTYIRDACHNSEENREKILQYAELQRPEVIDSDTAIMRGLGELETTKTTND
jgi:hypothetical protein